MGRIYRKPGVGTLFYSQPVERFDKTKGPVKFAAIGHDGFGSKEYRQKKEWERVMGRPYVEPGLRSK